MKIFPLLCSLFHYHYNMYGPTCKHIIRLYFRVGINLPTIEVKYEHLTVEADINTGSRALPSFINFYIDIAEVNDNNLH